MKNFDRYILISIILIFSECRAQSKLPKINYCSYLKQNQFKKNEIDTVIIKGTYRSMGKFNGSNELTELEKEGKLHAKDFSYAVHFFLLGCKDAFYVPCKDKGKDAASLFSVQVPKTIFLTCIVFRKYRYYDGKQYTDTPYFVVDKIRIEE
jgi:hypothetical protein